MTARCHDPRCTDGPPEGDEPRPRWAEDPDLLCPRCGTLLEQRLGQLPALAVALQSVLGGLRSSVRGGNKPTKGSPPIPLNIGAHDHLTAMQATCVSWVRLVCEERGLRGPDRDDLGAIAAWLLSQLPWLLQHDAVGDFADEVRDLTSTADGLAQTTRRPVRVGADCFDCGGNLVRRVTADGLEEDHVTCTACHVQYEPSRYLLALKAAAEAAAWIEMGDEQWATPVALAGHLGRPVSTLRVWMHRGLVRHITHAGIVFVHVADVTDRHEERKLTA